MESAERNGGHCTVTPIVSAVPLAPQAALGHRHRRGQVHRGNAASGCVRGWAGVQGGGACGDFLSLAGVSYPLHSHSLVRVLSVSVFLFVLVTPFDSLPSLVLSSFVLSLLSLFVAVHPHLPLLLSPLFPLSPLSLPSSPPSLILTLSFA